MAAIYGVHMTKQNPQMDFFKDQRMIKCLIKFISAKLQQCYKDKVAKKKCRQLHTAMNLALTTTNRL